MKKLNPTVTVHLPHSELMEEKGSVMFLFAW